jgi:hypothetical protein
MGRKMVIDILLSIGLNAIPIIIAFIPYILLRNRRTSKALYLRLYIGFSFFWIFYNILPAVLFQATGTSPVVLLDATTNFDIGAVISYYLVLTVDTIFNIFNFLINSWPLIFVAAPLLAVLIIIIRLRKEKAKLSDKFSQVGFEYRLTPVEIIKDRLRENSWMDEKQFLKLLVALLPLSLYILIGVLQTIGFTFPATAPAEALGWFVEVFVIYLLIPITAIHLLYVSRVSYQGKFFGERLRQSAFYYLLSVGAILSALTVILLTNLLAANPDALATVIYFASYYIMSAVIFTVSLPVYESLSSFLLVKVSNFMKGSKSIGQKGLNEKGLYSVIFGIITFFAILIVSFILSAAWAVTIGQPASFFDQFLFATPAVGLTIINQISLEANIILSFGLTFIGLGIWSGISALLTKLLPSNKYLVVLSSFVLSFIIAILLLQFDIPFIFGQSSYFVAPAPSAITIVGGSIFLPRAALLPVDYISFAAFGYAATPFYVLRSLCSALLLTTLIYYWGVKFKTEKFGEGDVNIEIVFSKVNYLPGLSSLKNMGWYYLLMTEEPVSLLSDKKDLSKAYKLLSKKSYNFSELKGVIKSSDRELFSHLRILMSYKSLGIYQAEFYLPFYKADLKGLFVVSQDGRNLYSYAFSKEETTEPVLVAGMLSAISSFVKETTKSRDLLRSIDHGDTTLLVEYGRYSFAALLADRETTELRNRLEKYIQSFEKRHEKILADWDGDVSPFEIEKGPVEEVFVI